VESIEKKLERHDIHVGRDSNLLRIGMPFEEALELEAKSCDAFMVLVTENSAQSQWVRREVNWAVGAKARGMVQQIFPLLYKSRLDVFPELKPFHALFLDENTSDSVFERLARDISSITRRTARTYS
jgi:TIR domain-containing protein